MTGRRWTPQKVALLQQLVKRRRIESGGPGPAAPAPAEPTPTPPGPPAPPAADGVRFAVESRWEGGSCGRFEVAASKPLGLGGARIAFTLPAGTRVAQSWNAELSGDSGRVTAVLPGWARAAPGAAYTATGLCLAGPGTPGALAQQAP